MSEHDATPTNAPETDTPAGDAPAESGYSFFQMFFVPMLIAMVLTGVIVFFGLIGNERKSVGEYLDEIKLGSQHQRWQSAYELAYHLQSSKEPVTEAERLRAVEIFEHATADDEKIREYLAVALGQMKATEAVPALVKAMDDPSDKTRIYALMALGAIGDRGTEAAVVARLADKDPGIRKAAAFALGSVGGELARAELVKSLNDPVPDVGWNSALSLARLGDASGKERLLEMVDRERLRGTPEISEAQVTDVLESAAKALGMLKIAEGKPQLEKLATTDPDHRVREAAHASLEALGAGTK